MHVHRYAPAAKVIRPGPLRPGDTVGVFTPSYPAHVEFRAKYLHGLANLRKLGFRVIEGDLTARASAEGYRAGSAQARADEFMGLIKNPDVRALVATIGGWNSSSMLKHLDFDEVRRNPKIICGYSDITALQMAVLTQSGLSTFYGPAVVPSFGDWPDIDDFTRDSFLDATQHHLHGSRPLGCPPRCSNHFRDARTAEWCTGERCYSENSGWRVLRPGRVEGHAIIANLNTLLALAGTNFFPPLAGRILVLEQMECRLSREERLLRQLEAMGALDRIAGLIVGKPEVYDAEGAPFTYDDLLLEVLGVRRSYPVVTSFDCSHTVPMLTLAQMCKLSVDADRGAEAEIRVCEPMVSADVAG
jgi:muramoyltetrapeptide carboxypeptidase